MSKRLHYNSLSANVMMLPITWLLSLMGHSVKCNYVVTGMVYSNLVSRNIKGGPQRACFGKEWKNATNFLLPSWLVRVPNEPKPPYFVEVWRQMCPSPTRRLPTYYTSKYLIFKSNMIQKKIFRNVISLIGWFHHFHFSFI